MTHGDWTLLVLVCLAAAILLLFGGDKGGRER